MKYLKYILCILVWSISSLTMAADLINRCHRMEGMRLNGCSPQAHPLDCGPLKECPPVPYYLLPCGVTIVTTVRGGVCAQWADPVCHSTPDGQVCDDPVCLVYLPPTCSENPSGCGNTLLMLPQPGTYSCSTNECVPPPPPPGYGACCTDETGRHPKLCPCTTDQHCTGG